MFAARNIELCTKDCVCLYVCPTGATDTENGKIDAEKCIDGCRLCIDACPSGAIYLVYQRLPKRPLPQEELVGILSLLLVNRADSFIKARVSAEAASREDQSKNAATFLEGLARSNQVLAEDCVRESGHLVPEPERLEELMKSGLLQELYQQDHKNSESLESLVTVIINALEEHEDAEEKRLFLCHDCGHIAVDQKPEVCPDCGSDSIKEFT